MEVETPGQHRASAASPGFHSEESETFMDSTELTPSGAGSCAARNCAEPTTTPPPKQPPRQQAAKGTECTGLPYRRLHCMAGNRFCSAKRSDPAAANAECSSRHMSTRHTTCTGQILESSMGRPARTRLILGHDVGRL